MTSYVSIPNGDIDQDSPITQPLMTALRDNPIAIAEGATGAPRLWLPAIERLEAGTSVRSRSDGPFIFGESGSYILHSFSFIQSGTIRVTAQKVSGTSLVISRTRNGTTTALLTATTNAVHTLDVSVLPGDTVSITGNAGVGGGRFENVRFQTNGQDLWPGSGNRLEGNRSAT